MNVLIGVDDSPHAEKTLHFVGGMAWPRETKFVVTSAVQSPIMTYSEPYAMPMVETGAWLEALTSLHRDVATRGARTLTAAGLHAEALVLQGDPREVLIEEAKKERANLMVVGSHGRTGIGKLVMGSVASHVVTHAPCSVLVVR